MSDELAIAIGSLIAVFIAIPLAQHSRAHRRAKDYMHLKIACFEKRIAALEARNRELNHQFENQQGEL